MTSDFLHTEDLLQSLNGRIAVVGNATPPRAWGKLIDSYDHVIRFNNYRIEGFESLVGTRTSYRCINGWVDIEHREEIPEFSPFTPDAEESGNLSTFLSGNSQAVLTAKLDVHTLLPELSNPSAGLSLALLLDHLGIEADLFCFDGFRTGHYWDQASCETTHKLAEGDILLSLPNMYFIGESYPYQELYDYCHYQHADYSDNVGFRTFQRLNYAPEGLAILELGSGNGALANHLETYGNRVTAYEVSEYAISQITCSRKVNDSALGLVLEQEPHDLFISIDVLEHLTESDIRLTIREAARLCDRLFVSVSTRPSGLLGPNGENLHLTVRPIRWWAEAFGRNWDIVVKQGLAADQFIIEGQANRLSNSGDIPENLCLKTGYVSRVAPEYFRDSETASMNLIWQADVYHLVDHLAERLNAPTIIDIGCGEGRKLTQLQGSRNILGVDFGDNLTFCRDNYSFGTWIEADLEHSEDLTISEADLKDAVIVCSDVIEHLKDPRSLLRKIRLLLERAQALILSTPERDLARGFATQGPPTNPAHVREWNLAELENLLGSAGLNVAFLGLTASNNQDPYPATITAVVTHPGRPDLSSEFSDARLGSLLRFEGGKIQIEPFESVLSRVRRAKALIVCEAFWPLSGYLAEVAMQVASQCQALGYEVTVATPGVDERPEETHQGLRFHFLDLDQSSGDFAQSTLDQIRGFIEGGEFEVCVLLSDPARGLFNCLKRIAKSPRTFLMAMPSPSNALSKPENDRLAIAMLTCDKVISNLIDPVSLLDSEIRPIALPLPHIWERPERSFRKDYGIPDDQAMVTIITGLDPDSGALELLSATRGLPGNWRVVIICPLGTDGELQEVFRETVLADDRNFWLPDVAPSVLTAAIQEADVVVTTLQGLEGQSVVLRAMEAGRPWLTPHESTWTAALEGGFIAPLEILPIALATLVNVSEQGYRIGQLGQELWRSVWCIEGRLAIWRDTIKGGAYSPGMVLPGSFESRCASASEAFNLALERTAGLLVAYGTEGPRSEPPFRIIAIIAAFNEADVILRVVEDLIANGIDVYFMDNHSTDNTVVQLEPLIGHGLIGIETYPWEPGGERNYEWGRILKRKAELAFTLRADWFIHADADEFREAPWLGVSLAEGIREVDTFGYSAITFQVLNFRPTDNTFLPGLDVRKHLTFCEEGEIFDSVQVKAWKSQSLPVDLATTGGHSADFLGRRVFPIPFILRHYPLRSADHARRKIFQERIPRFTKEEKDKNWHVQYDDASEEVENYLWDPSTLKRYDPSQIRNESMKVAIHDLLYKEFLESDENGVLQLSLSRCSEMIYRRLGISIKKRLFFTIYQLVIDVLNGKPADAIPPEYLRGQGMDLFAVISEVEQARRALMGERKGEPFLSKLKTPGTLAPGEPKRH